LVEFTEVFAEACLHLARLRPAAPREGARRSDASQELLSRLAWLTQRRHHFGIEVLQSIADLHGQTLLPVLHQRVTPLLASAAEAS